MKVKCHNCHGTGKVNGAWGKTGCDTCNSDGVIEVNPSTPDLIAELERRRPCERCEWKDYKGSVHTCNICLFAAEFINNFKEAK